MNGGYLMVSKADTKIYDKLQLGLKVGKPILWYESVTVCYYIDTISGGEITTEMVDDEEVITYGDIILTKGGKTITVSYDGTDATVTEEGSIANPVMENIKDKDGNLRFIEGKLTLSEVSGITFGYNKWSLSGTHLMIVLGGTIANGSQIANGTWAILDSLPQWIQNKIEPIFSTVIDSKIVPFYASDFTSATMSLSLYKDSVGIKIVRIGGTTTTFTADRNFRIQFDLLIDNDFSE